MDEPELVRTEDDVERILRFAKFERKDFQPVVQCIAFDVTLDNECVQLMEVDKQILCGLQQGQTLFIRGLKDDSAVLCSSEKTYDVKLAETSNTMLIIPNLKSPEQLKESSENLVHAEVQAMKYSYYEVKPIRPRLQRLRNLLEINQYNGWEYEDDDDHQGKKYTYEELRQAVQASDGEMKVGLEILQTCEINGFVRMLHFDFMARVVEEILKLIDEQSWGLDDVPEVDCCDILQDLYPRSVVRHILHCFADPVFKEGEDKPSGHYRLNEDKTCRLYAEIILKPSERFRLEEFLNMWQQSVPDGMSTGLYQLEGVALIDNDSRPPVMRYYPAYNLPENLDERFEALFRERPKWTLEEITPYIRDLTTEKLSVGAMLMKFARASTQNGIKFYSSKKPLA